jgi:CO/xanthine dehydrogenase FAD-binding subunit
VKDVQYFAPDTMRKALTLLGTHGSRLRVLAGGTDLVRNMNLEFKVPDKILWIGKLELEYIRKEDGLLHIGAATRMQTAGASRVLQEKATAVAQAAGKMAAPPVRSLATLGGNICNASPAADAVCALLALGAEVSLRSRKAKRVVPLDKFFRGPGKTVIKPGELLTEIRLRPTGKGEGSAYAKVGRRQALTLAVLNAAARVELDSRGRCVDVRIAIGAAAPTPIRARKAEALLRGKPFTHEAIARAAEAAVGEIKPIDDVHGTAWYRRKLTRVLVARVLAQAGGLGERN